MCIRDRSKNICRRERRFLLINRREAPHFSMDLSSAFGKKVGDFKKKESESLVFTGLEIIFTKGELLWNFLNNVKHVNLIFLEYVWGMEIPINMEKLS